MKNVRAEVKEGVLNISINLNEETVPSQSGKTDIIASTYGATRLMVGDKVVNLNLNVYTPKKR